MQDLITIIVPVYNVEKYINRCLDSILKQTYTHLEIILIDDGSTDYSGLLCDQFCQKDVRVQTIHTENKGLSNARNLGLDSATGDYIVFVDSDDYIDKDMINTLYHNLRTNNSDISLCSFIYTDEHGEILPNKTSPIKDEILNSNGFLNKLSNEKYWYYVVAWNKLYKKELFEHIRFQSNKVHEDEFIFHEIANQCTMISTLSRPLYYYTQRKNSIMQNEYSIQNVDRIEALIQRAFYLYKTEKFHLFIHTITQCHTQFITAYSLLNLKDSTHSQRLTSLMFIYKTLLFHSLVLKFPLSLRIKLITFVIFPIPYVYIKNKRKGNLPYR